MQSGFEFLSNCRQSGIALITLNRSRFRI